MVMRKASTATAARRAARCHAAFVAGLSAASQSADPPSAEAHSLVMGLRKFRAGFPSLRVDRRRPAPDRDAQTRALSS